VERQERSRYEILSQPKRQRPGNWRKVSAGIYHFRPHAFDLELIRRGDHSKELAEAALGQMIVRRAQVSFIWSAVVARSKWKYRQRAYRYIYLDAGHIAGNLYLARRGSWRLQPCLNEALKNLN